jgi:hypothetical protein
MALHGGGHHGGGHHGGGGFRGGARFGGGFGPAYYGYDYAPEYVPVFVVDDEEDRKKKEAERRLLEELAAKVAGKKPTSGLGIFAPSGPRPMRQLPNFRRQQMQGLGAVTFGNTESNQTVYEAQVFLNSVLKSSGYLQLTADGKLGKATCGACAWLMQGGASDYNKGIYFDLNTVPQSVFEIWNVCASSSQTPPTPVTATAKTSSYQVAVTANAAAPLDPQAVMDAQTALNVALAAAGMCAIGVDGKAGPDTCGAQTWLIANAGGDGLTQAQRDAISLKCSTSTKTVPHQCGQPVITATPAPAPTAPPPAPFVKPPVKTASIVMGVGIAAAVAGGLYYYFKHKSGG